MRYLLTATLILMVASVPLRAADKQRNNPKPNVLTPQEIAEGWLLLFDGESTFGWKINGAAEAKDGVLILGKGKKTIAYPTTRLSSWKAALEWQGAAAISFASMRLTLRDSGDSWNTCTLWNQLHQFGGRIFGGRISGGGVFDDVKGPREELKQTSLIIETDGKHEVRIRNFRMRPDPNAMTPLFTGKNLDDWKVNGVNPKRMASQWSITKAGELSVKNGPGDLVSAKSFDNFVLQFECKTNGKALNSGVFFRCIPGQYQNGYEAQIQNAYKGNDRSKPADFGTGAIYRRVPARQIVSNDHEWFTMTLVADGKHIATWVNGYQTVDWTDTRDANENPRKGYRAAKGPLSLQGHDPTTDILFRNIRITELPKK